MPELPEVETVVRTLEKQIKAKKIEKIDVRYAKIVDNCGTNEFIAKLQNQHFNEFSRRGKYLLFYLDDYVLIVHLRMEGKFFIYEKTNQFIDKHTHIIFTLSDCQLHYNDVRKFGRFYLYNKNEQLNCLNKLGLEPFDEKLNGAYLKKYCSNITTEIKSQLLDQQMITGIGNIYADEICFRSSINPFRKSCFISENDFEKIIASTKVILSEAISQGGTTIRSYTSSLNVTGRFQQKLMVHQRENQHCYKCNNIIKRVKLHGRSTYWCDNCQKQQCITIALSGSIGSGKSTVMNYLKQLGYKTISCDDINSQLLQREEVTTRLSEILKIDKALFSRKVMADIIFNDKDKKEASEKYLHEMIMNEVEAFIKANQQESFVFVEVPLLFEVNWDKYFDYNILIYTDEKKIIDRLLASRDMTKQQIELRLANQMSVQQKKERANYSINNDGSKADLLKKVDSLINFINK